MNGYVEAGYVVVLGTLSTYGAALVGRERAARRRVRRRIAVVPVGTQPALPRSGGAGRRRIGGDAP